MAESNFHASAVVSTHTRDSRDTGERVPPDPRIVAEFDALVRRSHERIFRMCNRILRNDEVAREVAQDALETAYRKLAEFDQRSSLSTWICGIARNLALNKVRRRGELLAEDGVIEAADPSAGVLRVLSRAERTHVVHQASQASLTPLEQEVVHLRYVENLPYEVIAAELELAGGRKEVHAVMERAKRHLRKELPRRLALLGRGMSFVRSSSTDGVP